MNRSKTVHYWHNPELPGIEANQMLRSRHVFPRHVHDDLYAVGLMDEGGSDCLGDGKEKSYVAPGEICLINPGQVHAGGALPDRLVSYRMVFIDFPLMQGVVEETSDGRFQGLEYNRVVVQDGALRKALHRLHQVLSLGGAMMALESALVEAVAHFLSYTRAPGSKPASTGRESRAVQLARDILSAELERKLSLAEVAGEVGLSRYHFLRVFKKETGISPHAFRTAQRLETSKRLLREGVPLSQAALDTGFSDQSHFTNTFRTYYGTTPGQYLAAHR